MRIKFAITALAVVLLAACTSVPPASDIPASIASATTAEDHRRVADFFAKKAAGYESEAAWHEKMTASYVGRPKGDLPAMATHCRSLRDQFAAAAQDGEAATAPEHNFTGNVGVVSQYVFRGLSQTNGKPALQGGIDYTHASGLYAGTWLSNISWFTDQNAGVRNNADPLATPGRIGPPYVAGENNSARLEWDFYGGYKNTFAGDWNYDVGVIQYYYPGRYDNLGAYRRPDTTEVYGAIGYKWLTLKYSRAVGNYAFGVNESRGASYADLSAQIPLGESGYSLLAHVGRQNYPGKPNVDYWGTSGGDNDFFDYTDYKLGLSKEYWGFNFGLAWTYANTRDTAPDCDTTAYMNAYGNNIGRSRLAPSISKGF